VGKKIVCIFCGHMADIVVESDSALVACNYCKRDIQFGVYRKMLDDWLDEVQTKRPT
jgi:CxxC motif-containing protein